MISPSDEAHSADYLLVSGGEFIFGADNTDVTLEGYGSEPMRIAIPSFFIKRTVVTVGEWRVFLQDSRHAWDDWDKVLPVSPSDNHPISYVSWHDAQAYCAWSGKVMSRPMRLPNELEWEKTCRGNDGQDYPVKANSFDGIYNWTIAEHRAEYFPTRPVARDPQRQSPYGCLDMFESVGEWCGNIHNNRLIERLKHHGGDVAAALAEGNKRYRVFRGGGPGIAGPPCTRRGCKRPIFKHIYLGFRPVLDP